MPRFGGILGCDVVALHLTPQPGTVRGAELRVEAWADA